MPLYHGKKVGYVERKRRFGLKGIHRHTWVHFRSWNARGGRDHEYRCTRCGRIKQVYRKS